MGTESIMKARLAHSFPGRLRLRFENADEVWGAGERIGSQLSSVPGIQAVDSRTSSRSIIIKYDEGRLPEQDLIDRYLPSAGIELIIDRKMRETLGLTVFGGGVVKSVSSANKLVAKTSRGFLDLRDIFPLTLFGFGISKVLQGQLQAMPWYNLLYYGYTTFYTLHSRKETPIPNSKELLKERYVRGEIKQSKYQEMMAEIS